MCLRVELLNHMLCQCYILQKDTGNLLSSYTYLHLPSSSTVQKILCSPILATARFLLFPSVVTIKYFIPVLICISNLINNEAKHLFVYLRATIFSVKLSGLLLFFIFLFFACLFLFSLLGVLYKSQILLFCVRCLQISLWLDFSFSLRYL